MMPKAAFQFGVKMSDGRKGHKQLGKGVEQKEQKQLKKIQGMINKDGKYSKAFAEVTDAGGQSFSKRRRIWVSWLDAPRVLDSLARKPCLETNWSTSWLWCLYIECVIESPQYKASRTWSQFWDNCLPGKCYALQLNSARMMLLALVRHARTSVSGSLAMPSHRPSPRNETPPSPLCPLHPEHGLLLGRFRQACCWQCLVLTDGPSHTRWNKSYSCAVSHTDVITICWLESQTICYKNVCGFFLHLKLAKI